MDFLNAEIWRIRPFANKEFSCCCGALGSLFRALVEENPEDFKIITKHWVFII